MLEGSKHIDIYFIGMYSKRPLYAVALSFLKSSARDPVGAPFYSLAGAVWGKCLHLFPG